MRVPDVCINCIFNLSCHPYFSLYLSEDLGFGGTCFKNNDIYYVNVVYLCSCI
jgi:hypothetical protein